MSEDVVLDTCAFRLLLKQEYVDGIIEGRDYIYVTKYSLKTERKGVRELRTAVHILITNIRKLRRHRKFKDVPVSRINLLPNIKRELENCGANNGDLKVATLAFDRKRLGQNVRLVSDDHCFTHDTRRLFENHEITIRDLIQENAALIQVNN